MSTSTSRPRPVGSTADGQPDTVIVNGTAAADHHRLRLGSFRHRDGLSAKVSISQAEGANDSLQVNGLAGNDTINASKLHAGVLSLTLNGGDGDDMLIGSPGNDLVIGGRGNDTAFMGAGDDTFVWNPGDGSDTVEGQGGQDTLQFNGANVNEKIDLSANGSRLRLFRDVGNVTMDVHGVEQVNVAVLGGADTITVNDLAGTDVTGVNLDLASATRQRRRRRPSRHGHRQRHQRATIRSPSRCTAGTADVVGLAAHVHITGAEPANDRLIVNALGGDDVVNASALTATTHPDSSETAVTAMTS